MNPSSTHHPGDDRNRLKAYLAGGLDVEERGSLEEHLADCDVCRSRLVELHAEQAELEQAFSPPEPILRRLGELGASDPGAHRPTAGQLRLLAAVLATVVLGGGLWIFQYRQPPAAETEPASGGQVFRASDAVQTLELLSPAADALLQQEPVDLRWTPVVDAVSYRVMILDPAGVPLTEHRTDQAHWRWSGGADAGFWYVEAELTDGSRVESEPSPLAFEPADSTP